MTLRYLTAGESHGPALVAIAEGFPAGLEVDFAAVNEDLRRRQKGYGRGGRQKIERDEAQFLAGLRGGTTTGPTPRRPRRSAPRSRPRTCTSTTRARRPSGVA